MPDVYLKPGRDKSVRAGHPWIFSGAIARVDSPPEAGDTVRVRSADGQALGAGAFSPASQIRIRMWTWEPEADVSVRFFSRRVNAAIDRRRMLFENDGTTAVRLVNAESDGLPGVVIDRYGEYLVCQFLSAGAERWKSAIAEAAASALHPAGIYERSDTSARKKEGLSAATGVITGSSPPPLVEIREGPCRYLVDVASGHKTGFYLDQRLNRAQAADRCIGRDVLNCFSYTGAFGIRVLQNGARHVVNVEASAAHIALAGENAALNGIDSAAMEQVRGDAFQVLRHFRDTQRTFDAVILDPPKFVDNRRSLKRASRGYKDINLLGFKLLRPGGLLFTFSCSGLMPPDLFSKIVADAALDAGRRAHIIGRLTQAEDHPVALAFPEGWYLKGLICSVE